MALEPENQFLAFVGALLLAVAIFYAGFAAGASVCP